MSCNRRRSTTPLLTRPWFQANAIHNAIFQLLPCSLGQHHIDSRTGRFRIKVSKVPRQRVDSNVSGRETATVSEIRMARKQSLRCKLPSPWGKASLGGDRVVSCGVFVLFAFLGSLFAVAVRSDDRLLKRFSVEPPETYGCDGTVFSEAKVWGRAPLARMSARKPSPCYTLLNLI